MSNSSKIQRIISYPTVFPFGFFLIELPDHDCPIKIDMICIRRNSINNSLELYGFWHPSIISYILERVITIPIQISDISEAIKFEKLISVDLAKYHSTKRNIMLETELDSMKASSPSNEIIWINNKWFPHENPL